MRVGRLCLTTSSTTKSATATATADSTIPFPENVTISTEKFASSDILGGRFTSSSSSTSGDTITNCSTINLSLHTFPSPQNLSRKFTDLSGIHLSVVSYQIETKHPITCLAVHGNVFYAASANEINVYDRATWEKLDVFNGSSSSSGYVKAVAVYNGKIFTAHQDGKIRVWQIMTAVPNKRHKLLTILPTVNDRLRRFVLPKNYEQVRRHKKRLWIEHFDAVTALAVNNGLIYSVSWDKSLKIWRASDLRCLESVRAHDDAINAVIVSPDGTVYTGSADRRIRIWAKPLNGKRHSLVATLEKHKSAVNALASNDDVSVLFSGGCDRSILVWEREESADHMVVTGVLWGHGKAILSLINVSDLLISGSADRTVRIWRRGIDWKYGCLTVLYGHSKPVKSLTAVSEDQSNGVVQVVSGCLDGEIKVWRVAF